MGEGCDYFHSLIQVHDVKWEADDELGSGHSVSICMNGNVVVEVHQAKYSRHYRLWYRVGILNSDNKTIAWGDSQNYDDGVKPTCALNSDLRFVEAHKDEYHDDLWVTTGTVNTNSKRIDFMPAAIKYSGSKGKDPALTMFAETVVMVFDDDGYLKYTVGTLAGSSQQVAWGSAQRYDAGLTPTCAMSGTKIVVAHRGKTGNELFYRTGNVVSSRISWSAYDRYDVGSNPALAMYDESILEVHQSERHDRLWYRAGYLDSNLKIQWKISPKDSGDGIEPTCAMNSWHAVEAHTNERRSTMFYSWGTLLGPVR